LTISQGGFFLSSVLFWLNSYRSIEWWHDLSGGTKIKNIYFHYLRISTYFMKLKTSVLILILCSFIKMGQAHTGFGMFQFNPGKTFSLTHKSTAGFELSYKSFFKDYARINMSIQYVGLNPTKDTVSLVVTSPGMPGFYYREIVYDNMNIIDINVGADFSPSKFKDFNPYAGFQIGFSNQEYFYSMNDNGNSYSIEESFTESTLLLKLGVGVNLVFSENLFIDVDYRHHIDFYNNTKGLKNSTMGISMNYRFNKKFPK
jgi:opacity protein-like surface antigen